MQHEGKRFRQPDLLLLLAAKEEPQARVGLTVSRKVGKAVTRNRVRRRLREILRTHPTLLDPGWDYVVIASPSAAKATFARLTEELTCLMIHAREWASANGCCSR